MAKLIISALEQAVMTNLKSFGVNQIIPQKMIASGRVTIKSNQVGAVVNNLVSKGILCREYDLFGATVKLTRSGKIQSTKLFNKSLSA